MKLAFIFGTVLFLGLLIVQEPEVVFRSDALNDRSWTRVAGRDSILDDEGVPFALDRLQDEEGMIFWRRQLHTPVCLSGECKAIDVGIYWDCTGSFAGLEVYDAHLTRTDHSVFTAADYDKLVSVLKDDWSILREYAYADLIHEPQEGVDAVTGATKKEISEETVDGAVYTTYTLWHLANLGEKDQLKTLTSRILQGDPAFFQLLATHPDKQYRILLLELFRDGKLSNDLPVNKLLLEAIQVKEEPSFRELAFKSLSRLDFQDGQLQDQLSGVYAKLSVRDKIRLLNALDTGLVLNQELFKALTQDLSTANEWFVAKTLSVIRNYPDPGTKIMAIAKQLAQSENSFVKGKALEFLER